MLSSRCRPTDHTVVVAEVSGTTMAWNSGNSAPSPWQFGSFSWRGEIVFVAGQGAVSEEPGNEGVQAGGDVGAAAGPAVEAGGGVGGGVGRAGGGCRWGGGGWGGPAWKGLEFPRPGPGGHPDGGVDVVADACS